MPIRSPIAVVLGHVDHGKTTLLDKIRGTSVAAREPGQITQWIGASLIPAQTIVKICGPLLTRFNLKIEVPGILFIDTPGHETFSNLRKRGGSAADVAVLVIDLTKGIEPQTVESLNILKARKTPFLVCCNKIDAIPGWKSSPDGSFLANTEHQRPEVLTDLDNRLYTMMGTLSRYQIRADRFDRIKDFTKTIALVPSSAKTGEGLPELMAMLVGLTQIYMKEEPGLGVTIDAMIFDGTIKVDDEIVLAGRNGVIRTRVRALLVPKPLDEIRDPRDKFSHVEHVDAAAGIKVAAQGLDDAIAGSPIYGVDNPSRRAQLEKKVLSEVESVKVSTDRSGVIVKADALGSLEALTTSLTVSKVPIRLADVGEISRRDVVEAKAVRAKDPYLAAILGFNVKLLPDAEEEIKETGIPVFRADIIYRVLEDYSRWVEAQRSAGVKAEMELLIRPGKMKILKGFVFRRNDPAIVGVEVLEGTIKPKYPVINSSGKRVGIVLRVQDQGKDVPEVGAGKQVAVSIDKPIVGRHIFEGDILYVDVPTKHAKTLSSKFRDYLSPAELALLDELANIATKNPSGAMA